MSVAQNTTNGTKKSPEAGTAFIRSNGRTAQGAKRSGFDSASASARRFTDQVTQAYGFTGEGHEELTRQRAQNLEVFAEAGAVLSRGVQNLSHECFSLMQERFQKNLDDFAALGRCRSIPEFLAVQSKLVRDNFERTFESTRRIAEISTRLANEASQTLTAQSKKAQRAA
jgi:phasin family protein